MGKVGSFRWDQARLDFGRTVSNIGCQESGCKEIGFEQKAAAQGHGYAMIQIAHNYQAGTGVEKNITTAKEWFQKAQAASDFGSARRIPPL
ncbi:MAG: hypothetical protein ACK49N_14170 [Verrucomicrobiota bacterium]